MPNMPRGHNATAPLETFYHKILAEYPSSSNKYPNCSVACDCGLALANFTVEYVRRLVRLWPVYRDW